MRHAIKAEPSLESYTATLNLIPSFGACTRSCFVPRYRSVVWTEACPSNSWICSNSPPAARHNFAHVRRLCCMRHYAECRIMPNPDAIAWPGGPRNRPVIEIGLETGAA